MANETYGAATVWSIQYGMVLGIKSNRIVDVTEINADLNCS